MSQNRNILVTGASGLVGGRLIRDAVDIGFNVTALVRDPVQQQADGVEWVAADLADPTAAWLKRLPPATDAVVHLAQSPHFREFPDQAGHVLAVNTVATAHLLHYARSAGARTFVLTSTGGVYGSPPMADGPLIEEPLRYRSDIGFYAATKLAAEAIADAYRQLFTIVNLRGFFIYGPGQKPHMLVPRLIDRVLSSQPITVQGPRGMRFNPLFVEDCSRAIIAALDVSSSMAVNVAGPEATDLVGFCDRIGQLVGIPPVYQRQEGTPPDWTADIARMRETFGPPRVGITAGIAAVLQARP